MMEIARGAALVSVLLFLAAGYNMVRMGEFIKPGTRRGARNLYPLWLKESDFTDSQGVKFRNQYYLCLAFFVLSLIVMAIAISGLPEGSTM